MPGSPCLAGPVPVRRSLQALLVPSTSSSTLLQDVLGFLCPPGLPPTFSFPSPSGTWAFRSPQTLLPFWNLRLLAGTVSLSSGSWNFVRNLVTGLRGGSCGRDKTGLSPFQSQEQMVFEGRTRARRPRPHRQTRCLHSAPPHSDIFSAPDRKSWPS